MKDYTVISKSFQDTGEVPRGKGIYYHCKKCGSFVASQPIDSIQCSCGNITIDIEYVRLDVRDFKNFELVAKK